MEKGGFGNRLFAVNSSVHLVKKFEWQLIFCLNTLIFISQTHMQKFSTYFRAVFFEFDLKFGFQNADEYNQTTGIDQS